MHIQQGLGLPADSLLSTFRRAHQLLREMIVVDPDAPAGFTGKAILPNLRQDVGGGSWRRRHRIDRPLQAARAILGQAGYTRRASGSRGDPMGATGGNHADARQAHALQVRRERMLNGGTGDHVGQKLAGLGLARQFLQEGHAVLLLGGRKQLGQSRAFRSPVGGAKGSLEVQ